MDEDLKGEGSVKIDDDLFMTDPGRGPLNAKDLKLDSQSDVNYFFDLQTLAKNSGLSIKKIDSKENVFNKIKPLLQQSSLVQNFMGSDKFKVAKTRGDGNCGLRAISIVITGDEDKHKELRKMALDEIKSRPVIYHHDFHFTHRKEQCFDFLCPDSNLLSLHRGFIMRSLASPFKWLVHSKGEYFEGMERQRTYITDLELKAIANKLGIDINTLFVAPNQKVTVSPLYGKRSVLENKGENGNKIAIVLLNHHEHFQPVVNIDCLQNIPSSCSLCESTFKTEASYIKHTKSGHAFPCDYCQLKFTTRYNKENHMNAEHNNAGLFEEESFCQKCGMRFARSSTYLRHIQTDHKETCSKCSCTFIYKSHLNEHHKEKHKKSKPPHVKVPRFTKFNKNSVDAENKVEQGNLTDTDSDEEETKESIVKKKWNSIESDSDGNEDDLDLKGVSVKEDDLDLKGDSVKEDDLDLRGDSVKEDDLDLKGDSVKEDDLNLKGDSVKEDELDLKGGSVKENDLDLKGDSMKEDKTMETSEMEREDSVGSTNGINNKVVKILSPKRGCKVKSEWFSIMAPEDDNNERINLYLRRVKTKPTCVYCDSCRVEFDIRSAGFAQIRKHSRTDGHKLNRKEKEVQGELGICIERQLSSSSELEIGLTVFAATHDIAFSSLPCLVKTLQKNITDSVIVRNATLGRTKATYGTKYGVSKTEKEILIIKLNLTPFSLSLDGGVKGRLKWITYIVRFFDLDIQRVREQFVTTTHVNIESGENVAEHWNSHSKENNLCIKEQQVSINTDCASVLRGEKKGAIKYLAAEAPMLEKTDTGGDLLHSVHNAVKAVTTEVFPEAMEFLTDTKYEITTSPAKEDSYLASCRSTGCHPVRLASFKLYRFLDRSGALKDRREHIDALRHYIDKLNTPKMQPSKADASDTDSNSSDDSNADEVATEKEKLKKARQKVEGRKKGRILRLKTALSDDHRAETELLLFLAEYCLRPSYLLLVSFQSQSPLIHVLHEESLNLFKRTLLEVVDPKYLVSSSGRMLTEKELKEMILETSKEKNKRSKSDNVSQRHATLKKVSDMLLPQEINEKIDDLIVKENLGGNAKEALKNICRERLYSFNLSLVGQFQHYLHIDVEFTQCLAYVCPSKINEDDSCSSIKFLASQVDQIIKESQLDDLCREWKYLQIDKSDFDENYETYVKQVLVEKKPPLQRIRIDSVWAPIITSRNFPLLSKLLMAMLSLFHGTASVEGSVNNLRNALGSRSHSMLDTTLESRTLVKSAVKSACTDCCHDFDYHTPKHLKNWNLSSSIYKSKGRKNDEDEDTDCEEEMEESEVFSAGSRKGAYDAEDLRDSGTPPEPRKDEKSKEGPSPLKTPKKQKKSNLEMSDVNKNSKRKNTSEDKLMKKAEVSDNEELPEINRVSKRRNTSSLDNYVIPRKKNGQPSISSFFMKK